MARAVPVLQALLMLVFMVGARVVMRVRHLARAKPAQLAMPMQGAGVGESVLVVGLTRLTELYLRSVADFAPERVRIAGLLVRSPHQAGRRVHGHQVLGAPDQVADALRELEEHGVMVDRIVVTTAFDRLLDAERDALLGVERSSGIRLEFIAERLGLEGSDVARPPAGSQSTSERVVVAFAIPDAELAAMARRPYWKMKRGLRCPRCSAPAGAVGSGHRAASASWWRSTSDGRSRSGSSDQVSVGDPSISTSCAPWPPRTTPMAAPFRRASAYRVSAARLRRTAHR